MKRLLTYGLLLLTILASHFVVSACQDDLPETTEVMVTFTTRTYEKEEGGETDAIAPEKMKDLRVIVLDGENIVIGNDIRTDIEQKSVVFSYATLVSDGETFKFLAIANEESAGLANDLAAIKVGSTMTNDQINEWKTLTISNHLKPTADAPLPQSKFWTWTSQKDAPDPNATLDYAASKISVQFKNETNAVQSLTDIKITGIGSATNAYLFAQEGNDFAEQQIAPSDIVFANVENLNPGATSTIQNYYSNPVSNILNPMLYATWMGEQRTLSLSQVKDKDGNTISLTSLKRNEYLQILVTLTGDGPVVNYTIHSWEENKTNIGDEAPTIGDEYHVDGWDQGDNIEIGGGGGNNGALNFIPEGTTALGGFGQNQPGLAFACDNNRMNLETTFPDVEFQNGDIVAIQFCASRESWLPDEYDVEISFMAGHKDKDENTLSGWIPYTVNKNSYHTFYFELKEYTLEDGTIITLQDFLTHSLVLKVKGVTASHYNHILVVGLALARPNT